MDKKKSLINVIVAIVFKVILLILSIVSRRFLIQYIGNDANGICSLYTSIIGVLAIADLGIGVAITYCMYDPITKGDRLKVAGLYQLFVKIYRVIGIIVLVVGLCVTPFLGFLAKDIDIDAALYYNFVLMLLATVVTYFFSAKLSLINAYKNNYIVTSINSIGEVIRMLVEITVLIVFKSFTLYIMARMISSLVQWGITEIYSRKKYDDIISLKASIDTETKKNVQKNVKAMFAHKIGGILCNTLDSIIISAFISVAILGKYSNYTTIVIAMNAVIVLFFTPLTAVIGHLCVKSNKKDIKDYFIFFYLFNFAIGIVFYLGYYATIDDLILICFGENLELEWTIPFVITINYFVQFLRQSMNVFRDATGVFYYDRYKPLVEGVLNVILSIILVQYIGVVGVIVATIATNLLVCNIIEPHVLYKYSFDSKPTKYYIANYSLIALFVGCLFLLKYLMVDFSNVYLDLVVNGFIAVGIAIVPVILIVIFNKNFRDRCFGIVRKLFRIKRNN